MTCVNIELMHVFMLFTKTVHLGLPNLPILATKIAITRYLVIVLTCD